MAHELHTENDLKYNFFPMRRGSLRFSVKAKNDAHIALAAGPSGDKPIYEVFIGGWANQKSAVRRDLNTGNTLMVDTPYILKEDKAQEFWIKWSDGRITVGRGGQSEPFLMYYDSNPIPIGYYGLTTGYGSCGEWLIEGARSIWTPDELKYQFWPIPSGVLTFDVRCKSNAQIALISSQQPKPDQKSTPLQIIIGGWENTISAIRRDSTTFPQVTVPTPSVVTASEFRRFIIRWKNGSVFVYHSKENLVPFLEYHNPDHVGVTHYGVRTAYGASGDWKIREGDDGTGNTSYVWKDVCSDIPEDAFVGANDHECIQFVGRMYYNGALLPGKVNPRCKLCYVSWEGNLESSNNFQILCGTDIEWIPTYESHIPCDAVIGGYSENDETLYIGRVHHKGTTTVGKVQRSKGLCYIQHEGIEIAFKEYEILVKKVH